MLLFDHNYSHARVRAQARFKINIKEFDYSTKINLFKKTRVKC